MSLQDPGDLTEKNWAFAAMNQGGIFWRKPESNLILPVFGHVVPVNFRPTEEWKGFQTLTMVLLLRKIFVPVVDHQ